MDNNPKYWMVVKGNNEDTTFYILKNRKTGTKLSNKYFSKEKAEKNWITLGILFLTSLSSLVKLRFCLFFIITLFHFNLNSQIIPNDRMYNWSYFGLKDTSTLNFNHVDLSNFGYILKYKFK